MSMQRKSFGQMVCPIARSLERVGEWWSILILRDALHGLTRFDQFQWSLGIAPNILTRRLNALVEAGLLERRRQRAHATKVRISQSRDRAGEAGFNYSRRQMHRAKEDATATAPMLRGGA